jgi:hypothetical protein
MFSVIHEKPDGTQDLFQAVQVQYVPPCQENGDCAGAHFLCGPEEAGPGIRAGMVRDGSVYVMNDKGSTVAHYNLTPSPQQPA